ASAGNPSGANASSTMVQRLERGIRIDAGPHDVWPAIIRKDAEPFDAQRERTCLGSRVAARGLLQGGTQLRPARLIDFAKKFETQVNVFRTHPLDRQGRVALPQRRERVPELVTDGIWKIQSDEDSNRLPRR